MDRLENDEEDPFFAPVFGGLCELGENAFLSLSRSEVRLSGIEGLGQLSSLTGT
jgi:hypothetical protein